MTVKIPFRTHQDILILLILGFIIRLYFLFLPFHADEFCDIMASLMIVEKGFPELPSGSWWLSGGPILYFEAPFIKIFGPMSKTIRIPNLILSTLSILSIYKLGSIVNKRAAIIAAILWSIDIGAIEWGSYARQYAIYPLFYFTSLYYLYKAANNDRHKIKYYCIAFIVFSIMIFSHSPSISLIPSMILFNYFFQIQKENYGHNFSAPILWNTFYVSSLLFIISALYYKLVSYLDPGLLFSASQYGSLVFWPETIKDAIVRIYYFIETNIIKHPTRLFSFLCAIAYVTYWSYRWMIASLKNEKVTKCLPNFGVILSLMLFSSIVFMAFFYYSQPGYILGLVGIQYIICAIIIDMLTTNIGKYFLWFLYSLGSLLLFALFYHVKNIPNNGIKTLSKAYSYVIENSHVGDASLICNPLFFVLEKSLRKAKLTDYQYCSQKCGLTLVKKEGKLYDRFMGGKNLKSIADFENLFRAHKRVWFVYSSEYSQNSERYPPEVTQFILSKMKKVHSTEYLDIYKYETN